MAFRTGRSKALVRHLAALSALSLLTGGCALGPAGAPDAGEQRVTLIHINDTHGKVDPHPEVFLENGRRVFRRAGGLANMATLIKQIRRENPGRTALLMEGDTFFTSGITALSGTLATVPVFNALGIDAYTPGNWDFQPSKETYLKRLPLIKFPVVARNLFDEATGRQLHPSHLVKDLGGVRLGVIGITSVKVKKEMAPAVGKGWKFTFDEGLREEIRDLREKEGVQIVVILSELGLQQDVTLARQLEGSGVDFIFGGETHDRVFEPIVSGGIVVAQAGSETSFLGRMDVTLKNGKVAGWKWKLHEVDPGKYPPDPEIQKLVDEAKAPYLGKLTEVVGETATPIYRNDVLETTADSLITDALREYTGADIAITRAFRYGYPILPGKVTMDDLYNIMPVNPKVRVGKITGEQYRVRMEDLLERVFAADPFRQSGGWVDRSAGTFLRFTAGAPPDRRLREILVNGKPLDPARIYTLAGCARAGDPPDALCQIEKIRDPKTLDATVLDVLRQYFFKHSPVRPVHESRIVATDLPPRVWSQFYPLGPTASTR